MLGFFVPTGYWISDVYVEMIDPLCNMYNYVNNVVFFLLLYG